MATSAEIGLLALMKQSAPIANKGLTSQERIGNPVSRDERYTKPTTLPKPGSIPRRRHGPTTSKQSKYAALTSEDKLMVRIRAMRPRLDFRVIAAVIQKDEALVRELCAKHGIK